MIIDRRLTFQSHISGVVKSCNYHLRALQHIRHLLPFSTAHTLAYSLIMSRLDYCNAVLYGCKAGAIVDYNVYRTMQRVLSHSQTGTRHHSRCYSRYTGCQCNNGLSIQETQLSLRDRATRACQLKSGKVLHKCRRLVFEKV